MKHMNDSFLSNVVYLWLKWNIILLNSTQVKAAMKRRIQTVVIIVFDYFKQLNVSLVNQSINVKLKYRYFFSSLGYVCMYVLIYSFIL